MAKLYFRYGAMGSSKTANAIMVQYNYQERNQRVLMVKPALENRDGERTLKSRCGLSAECVFMEELDDALVQQHDCVIVDEAQFLTEAQVQEIADMSGEHEFYCYGLKTDFMGNFFPGSAALMRLAEDISEVPGGLCWCGCKATMNARVNGAGQVIKVGEQVLIDNQQSIRYIGLCYKHWKMGKAYA